MKTILALSTATALMMGTVAYAQEGSSPMASSSGTTHMFEFNAQSILSGIFAFSKSKTKGSDADNNTTLDFEFNYAYTLPQMPRLQLGGRVNYLSGTTAGRGDVEDYGAAIGAILNSSTDLKNSAYVSLYWGLEWANTYGSGQGAHDEVGTTSLALGKRFSMEPWGIKHFTYTPEIAFVNEDSTTESALAYSQNLEFRFLQFSAFF